MKELSSFEIKAPLCSGGKHSVFLYPKSTNI
jgi:hypothetical protein